MTDSGDGKINRYQPGVAVALLIHRLHPHVLVGSERAGESGAGAGCLDLFVAAACRGGWPAHGAEVGRVGVRVPGDVEFSGFVEASAEPRGGCGSVKGIWNGEVFGAGHSFCGWCLCLQRKLVSRTGQGDSRGDVSGSVRAATKRGPGGGRAINAGAEIAVIHF